MEKLRSLDGLNRGIYKRWIWGNTDNYHRTCDYLQKINYSIQDLNTETENLSVPSMKEVVFVIVLVDWICEAVKSIQEILLPNIRDGFIYEDDEEVKRAEKYFKAIRSFVVAHPLNTSRHKDYGLDGDLICVDIRNKAPAVISVYSDSENWFYFGFDGLQENAKNQSSDFILCAYSQKSDGMQFSKYVRADFSDLYRVAKLQIDKLYSLSRYLDKTRKESGVS